MTDPELINDNTLFSRIEEYKNDLETKIKEMQSAVLTLNSFEVSSKTVGLLTEDEKEKMLTIVDSSKQNENH